MENKDTKNSIKKINIDDNIKLNLFRNLPAEALDLLGNILEKQEIKINEKKEQLETQKLKEHIIKDKVNININIPPPPPPNVLVPPPPPPPIFKTNEKKETIIDENGNFFGLSLGKSNKTDVLNTMKSMSKENILPKNNVFKYEDIGISFYFSPSGILEEISFYHPFNGKTSKGLSLNDDINKAIKLYGEPKIRTLEGAIWSKISLFLEDDIVTSIRIRK